MRSSYAARCALLTLAGLLFSLEGFAQPEFELTVTDSTIPYAVGTGAGAGVVSVFNHQVDGALDGVQGWALGVAHDATQLVPVSIAQGAYIQTLSLLFFTTNITAGGVTVSAVYSPGVLGSYEVPKEIVRITYQTNPASLVGNTTGTTTVVDFAVLGMPPVALSIVVGGNGYTPNTVGGTITLAPIIPEFIRGDANGDGVIEVLVEAIFMSSYMFSGAQTPPCLAALDTNADSHVNVADIVTILMWGFSGGPALPAPFPDCGPDPSAAPLPCDVATCP